MAVEKLLSIADRVVATGVSEDEYMARYAESFYEWVDGVVIHISPVTSEHDDLSSYVRLLFNVYFTLRPIGFAKSAPFVLKARPDLPRREPDVQLILYTNPSPFTETAMLGPADICIEVVSEGSTETDYVTEFIEYQRGGVGEYWIFDPLRQECRFYRLNAAGVYERQFPDADDLPMSD
jgi:Uma2 family endonuclease